MRLWFSFLLRPLLTLVESKGSKWNTDMPYTHFKKPLHKWEKSPLSGKERSWAIYHIMTSSNKSLLLCFTRTSASQWNCCRHDEKLILEYTASHIHLPQNLSLTNLQAIPPHLVSYHPSWKLTWKGLFFWEIYSTLFLAITPALSVWGTLLCC